MSKSLSEIPIYALKEDLLARGIFNQIDDSIQVISYDEFVELTSNHNNSSSWY